MFISGHDPKLNFRRFIALVLIYGGLGLLLAA